MRKDLKTRMDPKNKDGDFIQSKFKTVFENESAFVEKVKKLMAESTDQYRRKEYAEYRLSDDLFIRVKYSKKRNGDDPDKIYTIEITNDPLVTGISEDLDHDLNYNYSRRGTKDHPYNGPVLILRFNSSEKLEDVVYAYQDNCNRILELHSQDHYGEYECTIKALSDSESKTITDVPGSLFDILKSISDRDDLTDEERNQMEFIKNEFLVMLEPFGVRDEIPLSQEQITINQLLKEKADLEAQLAAKTSEITQKNTQITEQNNIISTQAAEITEKDNTISAQAAEITEKDNTISAQAAEITEKDEKIATQTAEITEKDETIDTQAAEIAQKDETISKLQAIKKELNRRLTALGDLFRSRAVLPSTKSQIEEILKESPTGQEPDDDDDAR